MKIVYLNLVLLAGCFASSLGQSVVAINSRAGYIMNVSSSILSLHINDRTGARLTPRQIYPFTRKSLSKSTKATIQYQEEDYLFKDSVLQIKLNEAVTHLQEILLRKGKAKNLNQLLSTDYQALDTFLLVNNFAPVNKSAEYKRLATIVKDIKANQTDYNIFGQGHTFYLLEVFKSCAGYRAVTPIITIDLRNIWRKEIR